MLRRVGASLAAARDVDEVARVAMRAARRMAQVDGGLVAVPDGAVLRCVLVDGHSPELAELFAVMDPDSELPMCEAFSTGSPVWLTPYEAAPVIEGCLPASLQVEVALAALPFAADGVVHGAVCFSWSTPMELDDVVRARLLELCGRVGRRLGALRPV